MEPSREKLLGEFRLGRQFTTPGQVAAIGITIFLGLLFLLEGPVTAAVDGRAAAASLIALAVMGLTLLSVVELLGGTGEYGGTYMLVHETLGGLPAFLTGWSILAGSLALLAALSLEAAAELQVLLGLDVPPEQLAWGLAMGLILIQVFQVLPRRLQLRFLTGLLSLTLLVYLLSDLSEIQPGVSLRATRASSAALSRAVAWLCTGYVAFEGLLAVRRQIQSPGKVLPAAVAYTMLAGGALLTIPLLAAPWLGLEGLPVQNDLVARLAANSPLPGWLLGWAAVAALVAGANTLGLGAARQINTLSREGAFPRLLRRAGGPFPLPPLLFALLASLVTPLILFAPVDWLINLAATLILGVMVALNIAAIYSYRTEPDRRRPFSVPFNPLVPTMSVAVILVLLRFLPSSALIAGAAGWGAGALYYFAYAQSHQVAAQLGEIVFRRARPEEARKSNYRILLPIGPGEERHLILTLATSLAHQLDGEVIPLQVVAMPDPLAIEEGRRTAQERNTLFQWSTRKSEDTKVPLYPITRLARSISDGIIDTAAEEDCDLILMPWSLKESRPVPRLGSVLDLVTREAPCNVAVVAYHAEGVRAARKLAEAEQPGNGKPAGEGRVDGEAHPQLERILVPTSGGPNAPLATRLALLLAREWGAKVSAVYVARPEATSEELLQGEARIDQTIQTMREQAADLPGAAGQEGVFNQIPIAGQVITSANIASGIAQTGVDYDLVLLGASEENLIDQVLFGNIPEQVARESPTPVVIVKRFQGLPRMWLRRTWSAIDDALPTLTNEEQIEVYRAIHRGARPDVDFFIMMALSTLIATYGLFQGSSAVIIGAMLVAPLFSPLLALSLGIVQGNMRLLRVALESNLKGVFMAIGLATLLSLFAPFRNLTPEILSRSQPNLTDLAVALASGVAGAYAIARKDVAAALPGVAIAAALVPPLGVIGIGLALGQLSIAGGGSLLFATNLVAIVLAGSVTFLLLGFRPGGQGTREVTLRRGLIITVVFFVLITIPLAVFFTRSVQASQTEQVIQQALTSYLEEVPGISLESPEEVRIDFEGEQLVITAPLLSRQPIPPGFVDRLREDLSQEVGRPVHLRLLAVPVLESGP